MNILSLVIAAVVFVGLVFGVGVALGMPIGSKLSCELGLMYFADDTSVSEPFPARLCHDGIRYEISNLRGLGVITFEVSDSDVE